MKCDDNSKARVTEAIAQSLMGFCRTGLSDSSCIELAINSIGIEETIMEANAGNRVAQQRMRHLAACYLNRREFEFGPIPPELEAFAARELEILAKHVPDPNRPDGGCPPRPYREKLWIAHWIHKSKLTQNKACKAFAEYCKGKDALSPKRLGSLYREMRPDIEALYETAQRIKATTVPIRCIDDSKT